MNMMKMDLKTYSFQFFVMIIFVQVMLFETYRVLWNLQTSNKLLYIFPHDGFVSKLWSLQRDYFITLVLLFMFCSWSICTGELQLTYNNIDLTFLKKKLFNDIDMTFVEEDYRIWGITWYTSHKSTSCFSLIIF